MLRKTLSWKVNIFIVSFKLKNLFFINKQIIIISITLKTQTKLCLRFPKINKIFFWCTKDSIKLEPHLILKSCSCDCQHEMTNYQVYYQNLMKLHCQMLFCIHFRHTFLYQQFYYVSFSK